MKSIPYRIFHYLVSEISLPTCNWLLVALAHMESALQKIFLLFFLRRIRASENKIGYRLAFQHVPTSYIQGWVAWPMTRIWKKFGLGVEAGLNYWTIGNSVNGTSSRFERDAREYQSWLGGYIVKRTSGAPWTFRDHFKLAVADQNSWLRSHGDPQPLTTPDASEPVLIGAIESSSYEGTLYEFGCTSHSDVGPGNTGLWFLFEWVGIAALFNASNPALGLTSKALKPEVHGGTYEQIALRGYVAVFTLPENVSVVLYANGSVETFPSLKGELRKTIESCKIVKVQR